MLPSNDQILPPADLPPTEELSVWATGLVVLLIVSVVIFFGYIVQSLLNADKTVTKDGFKNNSEYVEEEIDPETGKTKISLKFENQKYEMTVEMWDQLKMQAENKFLTISLPNSEIKDGQLWDVTLDVTKSEKVDGMEIRDSNFKKFLKIFENSTHTYGDKFVFRIYGSENYGTPDTKPARKKLTINYVLPKIKRVHYPLEGRNSYEFEPAGCSKLGIDLYQEHDCNSREGMQQIVKDFYEKETNLKKNGLFFSKEKEKYSEGSFLISHLNTVYADYQNDAKKYAAVNYYLVTDGGFQILPKDVKDTEWEYLIGHPFDEKTFMQDDKLVSQYQDFIKVSAKWQKNFCQSQDSLTLIGFVYNDNQTYYREAKSFFEWLFSSCEFKIITY